MSDVLDTLRALIREEIKDGLALAYEHGYNAGKRENLPERDSYRRGYQAGYRAAQRGSEARGPYVVEKVA